MHANATADARALETTADAQTRFSVTKLEPDTVQRGDAATAWTGSETDAAYERLGRIAKRPSPARPMSMIVMHWATVFFLCMAAALIFIRAGVSDRTAKTWLLEGHRHFGLFVLALFFIRTISRIRLGRLPRAGRTPSLLRCLAALTHLLLYALLLTLPLLGWALSNAEGKPVHLFGLTLPALVRPDFDLADDLLVWHQGAAWALLALVSLHVAAALWHHFILHDKTLRNMLPRRRRGQT